MSCSDTAEAVGVFIVAEVVAVFGNTFEYQNITVL